MLLNNQYWDKRVASGEEMDNVYLSIPQMIGCLKDCSQDLIAGNNDALNIFEFLNILKNCCPISQYAQKEKYPEYPDSLNSGFSVEYDTKNLEDGVYEFTLRLMSKDFQVLDIGPFKIKIEKKHQRPF